MARCKNCINLDRQGWCEKAVDSPEPNREMECYYFQRMTNADRIRAMTDEELAKFIAERNPDLPDVFAEYVLEWLKKEAKE